VCRSASLDHVTKLLREQLDHATTVNESLSGEVAKLTAERDDLEAREADFNREEQVQLVIGRGGSKGGYGARSHSSGPPNGPQMKFLVSVNEHL